MDTDSFEPRYTDRPFVYDTATGVRVPRNGFKGAGDRYLVGDAWMSVTDMERYELTPDEVLRLKLCFDRINRKSKREASSATDVGSVTARYWCRRRERLRALFNARYFRLSQLAVRTRFRYNMRPYIVTPPIRQCTHQYDTMLRRLCRLDGLPAHELQTKRVYIQHDRSWSTEQRRGTAGRADRDGSLGARRPLPPTRMNNDSLQRYWKAMNESELVNKSIKDQTQGGKSFLKQVVIPGKMLNCLYGKVLPDPTLRPDEIGLPGHIMETAFSGADMNKVAAVVKRDPVFSSDAITTFTRVVRNPYPYVTLPSEIITNKQLDFDGDNVSVMMVHSGRCFLETLVRLSAKIGMYCYFYRTRLTFSQTNGFRIAGFLRHVSETHAVTDGSEQDTVCRHFGHTFAHCRYWTHRSSKTLPQLDETLLSLAQQYGPFVAYGFLLNVRSMSFTGYNTGRIYPIGPQPKAMATHIAESGSKGTREAVDSMFEVTTTRETRSADSLEYAKTFIEAKTLIRKQGHNAKKMDSAFQNIVVDHDDRLVVRVNDTVYDLGHVVNYMQREWIMSDLTTGTILHGVTEDEAALRRVATSDNGCVTTSGDGDRYFYYDPIIEDVLYRDFPFQVPIKGF